MGVQLQYSVFSLFLRVLCDSLFLVHHPLYFHVPSKPHRIKYLTISHIESNICEAKVSYVFYRKHLAPPPPRGVTLHPGRVPPFPRKRKSAVAPVRTAQQHLVDRDIASAKRRRRSRHIQKPRTVRDLRNLLQQRSGVLLQPLNPGPQGEQIGRASCRERV